MTGRALNAMAFGFAGCVACGALAIPALAPSESTVLTLQSPRRVTVVRPMTTTKRASDALRAGHRSLRPLEPRRTPSARGSHIAGFPSSDAPPALVPAVTVPDPISPRLPLPKTIAADGFVAEPNGLRRLVLDAGRTPHGRTNRSRVRDSESAIDYLLLDGSLSDEQRAIVDWIVKRRRADVTALHAQMKRDLAWIERAAPNGAMSGATAARALTLLNAHIRRIQLLEARALSELRRALTENQWRRFGTWVAAMPFAPLDSDSGATPEARHR